MDLYAVKPEPRKRSNGYWAKGLHHFFMHVLLLHLEAKLNIRPHGDPETPETQHQHECLKTLMLHPKGCIESRSNYPQRVCLDLETLDGMFRGAESSKTGLPEQASSASQARLSILIPTNAPAPATCRLALAVSSSSCSKDSAGAPVEGGFISLLWMLGWGCRLRVCRGLESAFLVWTLGSGCFGA